LSLNETMVAEEALGWFQVLGYAVIPGPQLTPGELGAERASLCDVLTVALLCEAIRQINPISSKAPQATVAQPATVQSICWINR
jgi:type I restriction enzyme R subunit